jgi:hypothetical protein
MMIAALVAGCSSTKSVEWEHDPHLVYPVRVDSKFGFIDAGGKMVVEPTYDSVGWYNSYPIGVMREGEWGYIGRHGEVLFKPQFQLVRPFINGRAWFQHSLGNGLLNVNGRKLTEAFFHYTPSFINGWAVNVQGAASTCVVIDTAGYVYETKFCFHYHDGTIGLYQAGGKFGYATLKGRLLIKPKYAFAEVFSEGVAAVALDSGLYGYIDTSDNWVIQPKFKIARSFEGGVARVLALNEMWGVIDHSGKFITAPRFRTIQEFRNGIANASQMVNGRELWGLIDSNGRMLTEPQYFFIGPFSEGLAVVNYGGLYGYVDTQGDLVIKQQFQQAYSFKEGLAAFRDKRMKGFIDKKGTVVIPAMYDDVGSFNNGLAMATVGGTLADYFRKKPGVALLYIDRSGNVIWKSV